MISKVSVLYFYRGVSPLKDLKVTVGSTDAHGLLWDTPEDGLIPKYLQDYLETQLACVTLGLIASGLEKH